MDVLIWLGILFCISQSAMFSGLNLAFFSVSKLRLEVEAARGNEDAVTILELRKNANYLLTTILWGNVGINVLLTLLSNSVMAGVFAFLFSTIIITFIGEILPQAYFSRHAMRTAALLSPVLKVYQFLLYPVAKPIAWLLDRWLGLEGIQYFKEEDFEEVIKMHVVSPESDINRVEGMGAINFLALDDVKIEQEGEQLDPKSLIVLEFENGLPIFPEITASIDDPFLIKLHSSMKKWIVVTDSIGNPGMVIDSDGFIRDALFGKKTFCPYTYCHRPIIVRDPETNIGEVILRLKVNPEHKEDDVVDEDVIVLWGKSGQRILTGADLLGRLLRGVVR